MFTFQNFCFENFCPNTSFSYLPRERIILTFGHLNQVSNLFIYFVSVSLQHSFSEQILVSMTILTLVLNETELTRLIVVLRLLKDEKRGQIFPSCINRFELSLILKIQELLTLIQNQWKSKGSNDRICN